MKPEQPKTKFAPTWNIIAEFIHLETSAGILLFCGAVLAIIISNTSLQNEYHSFFHDPVYWQFQTWQINFSVIEVINDFLMTVFFLLVGLEVKREIVMGELQSLRRICLPGFAALGGMLVPALIFAAFNWGDKNALQGWAIPTATDIAFALGIVALLGKRMPLSVKLFLTTLAIFDDMGAILIIALFYQTSLSYSALLIVLVCFMGLLLLNRFNVMSLFPYIILGLFLWFFLHKSGIHDTLAGILLALTIPVHSKAQNRQSPLHKLEKYLHPWVAFLILPLFSFANAGISFAGVSLRELFSPLSLGIMLGLFLGKQLGVFVATWLVVKTKLVSLPQDASWLSIYGVSLVAGVGFTMSLFMGLLAYGDQVGGYSVLMRFGVFVGSCLSGMAGYIVLRKSCGGEKNGTP